jgi:hypothetical protein
LRDGIPQIGYIRAPVLQLGSCGAERVHASLLSPPWGIDERLTLIKRSFLAMTVNGPYTAANLDGFV